MDTQIHRGESHAKCVTWAYKDLVKLLFLGFFITCSFIPIEIIGSTKNEYVQDKLSLLSLKERFYLDHFFRTFVQLDALGYTLFGTKPICITAYFPNTPIGNVLFGENRKFVAKGWKVWKEIEKYFPHPKYIIFEESTNVEDQLIQSIYVINKSNFLSMIEKHKALFQNVLGKNFEANILLEKIEKEKLFLIQLKKHEGLLGILLGYGVESAMQYHRRNQMWKAELPLPYEEIILYPASNECPKKTTTMRLHINSIPFVGKPNSKEVRKIIETNQREREYIQTIYSKGNFLEITLQALIEP